MGSKDPALALEDAFAQQMVFGVAEQRIELAEVCYNLDRMHTPMCFVLVVPSRQIVLHLGRSLVFSMEPSWSCFDLSPVWQCEHLLRFELLGGEGRHLQTKVGGLVGVVDAPTQTSLRPPQTFLHLHHPLRTAFVVGDEVEVVLECLPVLEYLRMHSWLGEEAAVRRVCAEAEEGNSSMPHRDCLQSWFDLEEHW